MRLATALFVLNVYLVVVGSSSFVSERRAIDYFVRTTHKDLPYLLMLLRSVETFLHLSGNNFFVIFDEEVTEDHKVAAMMPKWVTVVFEPVPNITFPELKGAGMHQNDNPAAIKGWSRSQYSNFLIDQYGKNPHVGIFDADSMVKARCGETVSFFNDTDAPRIFCTQHRDLGMTVPRSLDPLFGQLNPWSCMESFPFIFLREDLSRVRSYLMTQTKTQSFNDAYSKIMSQMRNALDFGQFALLGAWAYTYHREAYSFAIGGNRPLSTCPELRVGIHVPYASTDWMNQPKLNDQYFATGSDAVYEGRCRAECTKSKGCKQYLASASEKHLNLLSLEGDNERMFGGGNHNNPYKANCADHVEKIFEKYQSCLQTRCKQE